MVKKNSKKVEKEIIKKTNSANNFDCRNYILLKKTIKSSSKKKNQNNKKTIYLEGIKDKRGFIYQWIDYNQFEELPTKIPIGFKEVPILEFSKEYINSHKCGKKKNITDINWDLNIHNGYQIYLTQYGLFKPFLVAIKNKHLVRVYSINNDVYFPPNQEKYTYYYNSLIGEYHPNRIFIGKSPKNATTIYQNSYGSKFNGNSFLLKLKKNSNQYLFIGYDIYLFNTEDEIIDFISPIIYDYIPCPFAIGKNNIYDMSFQKFIPIKYFSHIPKRDFKHFMYEYFDEKSYQSYAKNMMILRYTGYTSLINNGLYHKYLSSHIKRHDLNLNYHIR